MRLAISGWLCALLFSSVLATCTDIVKRPQAQAPQPVSDVTQEASQWADSVYSRLTLEEKLAQMLMPALYSESDPSSLRRLSDYADSTRVGGILLLKGDAESAATIARYLDSIARQSPFTPGTFLAMDAETGLGMRLSDAPSFPWNRNIGDSVTEDLFYDYGAEVGREASLTGINMILGPVVDVDRAENHGRGIMKSRSLGSDEQRVSTLSLAYIRGLESQGVMGVPKHFPGHGPTTSDSHKTLPVVNASREEIDSVDLLPFRTAIRNGLSCVMVGHLWAPALDSVYRPASFSPVIINDLLRKDMGFNGLVLVDAVGMKGASGHTGVDAIIAGADIIIAPSDTRKELDLLVNAVNEGRLPMSRVEETCKRILFHKYLTLVSRDASGRVVASPDILKERLHQEAPSIISKLKGSKQ